METGELSSYKIRKKTKHQSWSAKGETLDTEYRLIGNERAADLGGAPAMSPAAPRSGVGLPDVIRQILDTASGPNHAFQKLQHRAEVGSDPDLSLQASILSPTTS